MRARRGPTTRSPRLPPASPSQGPQDGGADAERVDEARERLDRSLCTAAGPVRPHACPLGKSPSASRASTAGAVGGRPDARVPRPTAPGGTSTSRRSRGAPHALPCSAARNEGRVVGHPGEAEARERALGISTDEVGTSASRDVAKTAPAHWGRRGQCRRRRGRRDRDTLGPGRRHGRQGAPCVRAGAARRRAAWHRPRFRTAMTLVLREASPRSALAQGPSPAASRR
jgi:hypothetical protein